MAKDPTEAELPEQVQDVVDRIVEGYDMEKIIIFGSYARGDWTEDSDLDLLVIKETEARPFDRIGEVSGFCWPRSLGLDILVQTPSELEDALVQGDLFVRRIVREGVVVHDRASS